jgi:DnaJ like chaperone protein
MLKPSPMNISGKIIGFIVGLFFGPWGAGLGLLLGHLYDTGQLDKYLGNYGRGHQSSHQTQAVFFESTFAIMGYIAKSDGRVSEQEITAARQVIAQLGLTGEAKAQAIKCFYYGKSTEFNLDNAIHSLRQACMRHPSLLRTFIEIQIHMMNAEGVVTPQKRAAMQNICNRLGLRGFNFNQYEQQSRAEENYRRYYGGQYNGAGPQQGYTSQSQINDAYKILGVEPGASKEVIKKAYRKKMSENHPDKLMATGLPPEMIKLANEKTAQIKKAYELVSQ